MKKTVFIFTIAACLAYSLAQAAVVVKKAAPVATKKTDAVESATSLLPSVIGLVSNVKTLSAQQQQLTADCAPTSDEINTVNNLVKEWAKIGDTFAEGAYYGLGQFECTGNYYSRVQDFDDGEACYEVFNNKDTDVDMVWENFPKASSAKKCDENGKNCKNISNIYDVFGKIPFSEEDYTVAEWKKVAKLKEKAERCAPEKIRAAKRELYGGFLTQAIGAVGQSSGATGTASVLEVVTSMGGSSDIKSMLPSLGQMALQGLDK